MSDPRTRTRLLAAATTAVLAGTTVTGVTRHPKDRFPTAAVYGPTPGPELRLVTCGGVFDRVRNSYRDNIVVFAVTQPTDVIPKSAVG